MDHFIFRGGGRRSERFEKKLSAKPLHAVKRNHAKRMAMKRIHVARLPGVFFLLGRELGGGLGEEQKGARSPALFLVSRFAPVPRTQRKNSGRWTGKRKETTGDLARMHAQP